MNKRFFMFIGFLFCQMAMADNFYSQHAIGWHWYDDPKEEYKKKPSVSTPSPHDAISQMGILRKTIKQALDQAILEPTPNHVESYMVLENQLSNRANQFADVRAKVLLSHPEFNYSLTHPTNNVALQVYHEEESKEKEKALVEFGKHQGLFFFYRSTCHYCQRFAPILKSFASRYRITVIPITMDGVSLPQFPDSRRDEGQAKKFQVTVEPSLFAVDPYTQKAYPVAFGLTSETELRDNIYNVITHYQGEKT